MYIFAARTIIPLLNAQGGVLLIKKMELMKIKSLLVVALMMCGIIVASAQSMEKFRFGATFGMNVSTITKSDMDSKIGFNAGLRGEYNFIEDMYLGVGLGYSHKGVKEDDLKASAGYIEIPVHFGYRMGLTDKISAFGEFGPYFGIGVAGKWKFDGEKLGDFFGEDEAKRFDMGLGLRAGVEFMQKYQVHIGYDFGLMKLYDEDKNRNGNFTLGVSYMF